MIDAVRFLLGSLGISDSQLRIIEQIQAIKELSDLSLYYEETQFLLRKSDPNNERTLSITLKGTMCEDDYKEERLTQLLEQYGLLSSTLIRERRMCDNERFAVYTKFSNGTDSVGLYIHPKRP